MAEEKKLEPELRFPGFHEPWDEKKLGDLGNFYRGLSGKNKDSFINGNKKYIQYLNIFENTIINNNFTEYGHVLVNNNEKQNVVIFGDLLFTQSSETLEEIGITSVYLGKQNVYLNSFSFGFRFDKYLKVDFKYIAYLFRSNTIRKRIMIEGQGSTRYNLASSRLEKLYIPLCEIQEQEKIGKFFYTIDKKLDLQKEKIEELKSYKKGMMQRIFNQEIRFKDENGKDYPDWEEKKLGDIFSESNERLKDVSNKNKYSELLSVTLNSGVKKQSELGIYDNSSKDKSNYKIVKKDYIVYNSMRMWQGASGKSNYFGIVSSAYVVMKPNIKILSEFVELLFKQDFSIYQFYKNSQGMTSDTLSLKYNFIKNISFSIPSLPEQEKIANFLSAIDKKIELEEEKMEEFEKFKKGLMQRMFI